jgi:hypothetical protein
MRCLLWGGILLRLRTLQAFKVFEHGWHGMTRRPTLFGPKTSTGNGTSPHGAFGPHCGVDWKARVDRTGAAVAPPGPVSVEGPAALLPHRPIRWATGRTSAANVPESPQEFPHGHRNRRRDDRSGGGSESAQRAVSSRSGGRLQSPGDDTWLPPSDRNQRPQDAAVSTSCGLAPATRWSFGADTTPRSSRAVSGP